MAGRAGVVTLAAVLLTGVPGLPGLSTGQEAVAAEAPGYAFEEGAPRVEGALSTADAVQLETGRTYRSTLPASGPVHYSLELDDTSNIYASATAVPPDGGSAAVIDGVKVSVQDGDGRSCDVDTATFGAAASPHPVAAWAAREISPRRSLCKDAGTYYMTVERADPDGKGASPDAWELELTTVSEPRPAQAGATTAPDAWNSASPEPVAGQARRRAGGAGFTEATPLDEGVWRDDIRPGRTLFYKVPVGWGRQFNATAELGSSISGGTGFVPAALDLDLYNPVRGHVADVGIGYDGRQKSGSLSPLPHVAYANRHAPNSQVAAMRFAGSYYLVAHLAEKVADDFGDGPVPLTLRVRVSGTAQDGPGYAGEPVPSDVFAAGGQDHEAAVDGPQADRSANDDTVMTALAVGGIGTGSALLVGLGVWTAVARRRTVSPG
ncbi:hypothetical protein ACFP51_05395 [Streptomyces pratens]|uniref:Uncharacterized protein n=1 Tax=Streptomyces pratens TaxID=887456 RepID=A0ABW1LUU1_9ACTN